VGPRSQRLEWEKGGARAFWAGSRGSAHSGDREEETGHAQEAGRGALAGQIPSEDEFPFLSLFLIFQSSFSNKF
jgi:hypothetical protein